MHGMKRGIGRERRRPLMRGQFGGAGPGREEGRFPAVMAEADDAANALPATS